MTSVGFYHLTRTSMEQALPSLLIRTRQQKQKGIVLCKDDEQLKKLTEILWNIIDPIWLPHGCHAKDYRDEYPEWQPIWLTTFEENPNRQPICLLFMVNQSMISVNLNGCSIYLMEKRNSLYWRLVNGGVN